MLAAMGNPHAPLTEADYRGDPAEDADRLEQWRTYVPEAISWLRDQTALDLDGSVESLRLVWGWIIDHLARSSSAVAASVQQNPPWARWRPYRYQAEMMQPEQVWLWGALSAYFGEVFIARAAAPEVEWRILRHPIDNIQDQGRFVLLRPEHISRRKPRIWMCPHLLVVHAIGGQTAEQDPRHRPRVGYNDPGRLQELLFMDLQTFGDPVPEMPTPEPDPVIDPQDTLARLLGAPEVAAVRAACPSRWVAVPEGLKDEDFTFTTDQVCAETGFGGGEDGEWSLFLHDSIRPVIDVDDGDDPLLAVLSAHPLVAEAEHVDRELYEWTTIGTVTEEEMAALALKAMAVAQENAVSVARRQQ